VLAWLRRCERIGRAAPAVQGRTCGRRIVPASATAHANRTIRKEVIPKMAKKKAAKKKGTKKKAAKKKK
jgi:hypothetical protein